MARPFSVILTEMMSRMPAHMDPSTGTVLNSIVSMIAAEIADMEERLEELIIMNGLNAPVANFTNVPFEQFGPSSLPGIFAGVLQDQAVESMNDGGDEAPADPPLAKPTRKSMAYWS